MVAKQRGASRTNKASQWKPQVSTLDTEQHCRTCLPPVVAALFPHDGNLTILRLISLLHNALQ